MCRWKWALAVYITLGGGARAAVEALTEMCDGDIVSIALAPGTLWKAEMEITINIDVTGECEAARQVRSAPGDFLVCADGGLARQCLPLVDASVKPVGVAEPKPLSRVAVLVERSNNDKIVAQASVWVWKSASDAAAELKSMLDSSSLSSSSATQVGILGGSSEAWLRVHLGCALAQVGDSKGARLELARAAAIGCDMARELENKLALAEDLSTHVDVDFIEIGTSDFRTVTQQLPTGSTVRGIAVEPLAFYLDSLPNHKNVRKVNAAVGGPGETSLKMYYVDPADLDGRGLTDPELHGLNMLGSPHPVMERIFRQRGLGPVPWKTRDVAVMTFSDILSLLPEDDLGSSPSVTFLKVDTEGFDAAILRSILDYNHRSTPTWPLQIEFESNTLSDWQSVLDELLRDGDYVVHSQTHEDTVLVLRSGRFAGGIEWCAALGRFIPQEKPLATSPQPLLLLQGDASLETLLTPSSSQPRRSTQEASSTSDKDEDKVELGGNVTTRLPEIAGGHHEPLRRPDISAVSWPRQSRTAPAAAALSNALFDAKIEAGSNSANTLILFGCEWATAASLDEGLVNATKGRVVVIADGEYSNAKWFCDNILKVSPTVRGVIYLGQMHLSNTSSLAEKCAAVFAPYASLHFVKRRVHTPLDLAVMTTLRPRNTGVQHGSSAAASPLRYWGDATLSWADRDFLVYLQYNCVPLRDEVFANLAHFTKRMLALRLGSAVAAGRCPQFLDGKNRSTPAAIFDAERRRPDQDDAAVEMFSKFKFALVIESKGTLDQSGYATEKIVHAFLGGAIPIYLGDDALLPRIFNPAAYIAVRNMEVLQRRLLAFDEGDYLRMRSTAPLLDGSLEETFSWHPAVIWRLRQEESLRLRSQQSEDETEMAGLAPRLTLRDRIRREVKTLLHGAQRVPTMSLIVPCVMRQLWLLRGLLGDVGTQTERPLEVIIAVSEVCTDTDAAEVHALANDVRRLVMAPAMRVVIMPTASVQTAGQNRNRAVAVARGDVVSFCDADDRMHPQRTEFIACVFASFRPVAVLHETYTEPLCDGHPPPPHFYRRVDAFHDLKIANATAICQPLRRTQGRNATDEDARMTSGICTFGHSSVLRHIAVQEPFSDARYGEDVDLMLRLVNRLEDEGATSVVHVDAAWTIYRPSVSRNVRVNDTVYTDVQVQGGKIKYGGAVRDEVWKTLGKPQYVGCSPMPKAMRLDPSNEEEAPLVSMRRALRQLAAAKGLLARGCQSKAVNDNGDESMEESTTSTEAWCSAAPPYIAVIGCGFSGAKAIASMLTHHLDIPTSHESLNPEALATSAVAGWPATVARYAAESTGSGAGSGDDDLEQRRAYTLAIVRHPLAVLRSVRTSPWDFTIEDAFAPPSSRILHVRDWLPEPLAAKWDRLSDDVRTLAWWCAFTILADIVRSSAGTSALLRVEDLFDRGEVGALKAVAKVRFGTDNLTRFDWTGISDAAKDHDFRHDGARDEGTAISWFELRAAALESNVGDEAIQTLELEVIRASMELSIRCGYALSA